MTHAVDVSVAVDDYDHVRWLVEGRTTVDGVRFTFHRTSRPAETFHRQLTHAEWDVSELSLAQFCHGVAAGDDRFVGLPVFPSRRFRHSSVFVRGDSALHDLGQLAGRRVGIPEWGQTAGVWVRGMLADRHHVGLGSVTWFQGGVDAPGRPEHADLALPPEVALHRVADRGLASMLVDGAIDAVVAARFPAGLVASGRVRTLLDDCRAAENAYFADTGIVPIMHVVVLRRSLHDRHPWLARDLVTAFTEARDWSLARLRSGGTPMYPVPHLPELVAEALGAFGDDPWPYGVDRNRPTLDTFCRYAHEQGLTPRLLAVEELFAPSTTDEFHG
jgi:4,5-dihydroxyphthalate decarboxylase